MRTPTPARPVCFRIPFWAALALAVALLALALAMQPAAASPADEGERLVEENCVDCHAVSEETYSGPLPTVYEIAGKSRYWTPTRFEAWLSSAHGPMPKFGLTSQDIYNLMQYLERLRSESTLQPAF